jgi:hypothetical protein
MPTLQIDTNDLRRLSPATIANRFLKSELIVVVMNLGYDPVENPTKKRLGRQIWDLLNKPPGQVILEVGAQRLSAMSARTIAGSYPDEDIVAAVKGLGLELNEGATEYSAAVVLKQWADENAGV